MAYFKCSSGSGNVVEIDGVEVDGDLKLVKKTVNVSLPNLPFDLEEGSAVVYEGEIHVLGGSNFDNNYDYMKHVKFNGTEWKTVSTLPCRAMYQSVAVYKGEIYLLYSNNFYKWDGLTWTSLTPPYSGGSWSIIVFSDKLYAIGINAPTNAAYFYDGSTWTKASTSVGNTRNSAITTDGNYIYILGGTYSTSSYTQFAKYDGSKRTSLTTLPYSSWGSHAEYINGEIHLLGTLERINETVNGGTYYHLYQAYYHYVFRNNVWVKLNDIPHACGGGASVVVDNCIYVIGSAIYTYSNSTVSNSAPLTFMFGKNVTIIDKPVYELVS